MVVSGYRAWLLQAGPAFETLALFGTEPKKKHCNVFFKWRLDGTHEIFVGLLIYLLWELWHPTSTYHTKHS